MDLGKMKEKRRMRKKKANRVLADLMSRKGEGMRGEVLPGSGIIVLRMNREGYCCCCISLERAVGE